MILRPSAAHFARSLFLWIALASAAWANPADYIYSPNVEYGERELDLKYGTATPKPGNPGAEGASIGLGYGAGEYWFTEVYLKQERYAGQPANLAEFENKFQLTETGHYAVDVGLITEVEVPLSANAAWELSIGPLLQKDFGSVQVNGNLIFRHAYAQPNVPGTTYSTLLDYQWQVKLRGEAFDYGLQGMGEEGTWDRWGHQSSQSHMAGPAVMGKVPLGGREAIRYNAAWLIGLSSAAPRNTFRMQVEFEY